MNPYIDPLTGTHFNKLGINNRDDLLKIEYAVTDLRVAELRVTPINGQYDLDHLKDIHKHIFQDIYDWAGKERTKNFSKRDAINSEWTSRFAPHDKIQEIAKAVSEDLKDWNNLKGLNQADFAAGITAVYVKLNYMHPFPEGNGRSTQTFISQLAREAGYELNFAKVDREEWNFAASRSMPQHKLDDPSITRKANIKFIQETFSRITEPIRSQEKTKGIER